MISASPANLLALLYALLLGAAAVQDVRTLRISNMFSVAILLVCIVTLVVHAGPHWWQHLLSFVLILALGMLLFSLGWMGGGDAKLMAASALAFDLMGLLRFLPLVLISGGLIALLAIIARPIRTKRSRAGGVIPYGVAIAVGAVASLVLFRDSTLFAG